MHHHSTVEQQSVNRHRHSDDGDDVHLVGCAEQGYQRFLSLAQQHVGAEKILTGVSRDAEFGEDDNLHALVVGIGNHRQYLADVVFSISNLDTWYRGCHSYISVFHVIIIL